MILLLVGFIGCRNSKDNERAKVDMVVPPKIVELKLDNDNATVSVNDFFALQITSSAIMSDGTNRVVEVRWDNVATTTYPGTFVFIGSAVETEITVKFTLKVNSILKVKKILISDLYNTLKLGEEFSVSISTIDFQEMVSTVDIRIIYDSEYLSVDVPNGVSLLVENTGLSIIKEKIPGELIMTFGLRDTNLNGKKLVSIKFKTLKNGKTKLKFGTETAMLNTEFNLIEGMDISDSSEVDISGSAVPNYIILSNKQPHPMLPSFFDNISVKLGADMPENVKTIEFRDISTDLLWDTLVITSGILNKSVVRVDAEAQKVRMLAYDSEKKVILLEQSIFDIPE